MKISVGLQLLIRSIGGLWLSLYSKFNNVASLSIESVFLSCLNYSVVTMLFLLMTHVLYIYFIYLCLTKCILCDQFSNIAHINYISRIKIILCIVPRYFAA